MKYKLLIAILASGLLCTLSGCGQSGGLYLPEQPPIDNTHTTHVNHPHEND